MRESLSPKAEKLVKQRLTWAANDLRHTAQVWQGESDSSDRVAYTEAADEIERIARDYR